MPATQPRKSKPPRTFADLERSIRALPGSDSRAADKARTREPNLTKPPGSLGRLEELAEWLAAWQGRHPPRMENPAARVFAANHGVTAQGVSAYPADVTAQMVANFKAGGAAVNQLCRAFGADLRVKALNLAAPTADFTQGPAMTEAECMAAIRAGMAAVPKRADVLCLGEMGIGNTTAAAALCLALHGGKATDWTGPGTGVKGKALSRKAQVVAAAVKRHKKAKNPLDLLARLGGRELAAIVGAVVEARRRRIPVLLDGYVCTAAAAVLPFVREDALDHCLVAHVSAERGHRLLVRKIGKAPLLDLNMRLGEASGAVLAVAILKAAAACHGGMATFAEAGVSGKGT